MVSAATAARRPGRAAVLVAAALTAVVFACRAPESATTRRFVIRQRGVVVGRVEERFIGERRDGAGPFRLYRYQVKLARWADGRGVVYDAAAFLAARRPGGPAYYARGRAGGTDFFFRRGAAFIFRGRDEFGNVIQRRGDEPPAAVTFRGVALPLATAPPRNAHRLWALELTDGGMRAYRGRRSAAGWAGTDEGGAPAWFAFDRGGAPLRFAGAGGLTLGPGAPTAGANGFVHVKPALAFLPFAVRPAAGSRPVTLALTARLSAPAAAEEAAAPGQTFKGSTAGNVLAGEFTVNGAEQGPLVPARPPETAAAAREFSAAPWGTTWPLVEGGGELERLAAAYRARGQEVTYVAGAGVFAGNCLAPYNWLEVGGHALAAPGKPRPFVRVVFARRKTPVATVAVAPEVASRGVAAAGLPLGASIPGLRDGDTLEYALEERGAPAGYVILWYITTPAAPPTFAYEGELLGRKLEGITWAAWCDGERVLPLPAGMDAFAGVAALGSAVATAREGARPPDELAFPLAGKPVPARLRWRGFRPVAVGGRLVDAHTFELEPAGIRATFTTDGVLTSCAAGSFAARLRELPAARVKAAVQSGETPPAAPRAGEEAGTPAAGPLVTPSAEENAPE